MSRFRNAAGLGLTGLVFGAVAYVASSFSLSSSAAQGIAELILVLTVVGVASVLFARRRN